MATSNNQSMFKRFAGDCRPGRGAVSSAGFATLVAGFLLLSAPVQAQPEREARSYRSGLRHTCKLMEARQ